MSTTIYSSPIFGPVHSRRLGLSLGINLMPDDGKVCTFDCIYCECGLNAERRPHHHRPSREEVAAALASQLQQMHETDVHPDVLTFAGNGEPTAHPDFPGIIDDTISLRDRFCPEARISVLSNATQILKPAVHAALMRIENNIQKLDTVDVDYIRRVDRPTGHYDLEALIEGLVAFDGHVIIQTMFMRGSDADGADVSNTSEAFVAPWLQALERIRPESVMIYTVARETPISSIAKARPDELDAIAERVRAAGLNCSVAY
ncbi:MAG: radical SAM protein [Bacteroidaceae bacterium]|nr:radical SAM protein [Bacteroidaceae bacterium]